MKILLLSDSNSPHTLRWAKSIRNAGIEVGIFSLHKINLSIYPDTPDIQLNSLNLSRSFQSKNENNISKLIYIKAVSTVKKIIKEYKPDIVHAHYASSYGLIGALTGFHPFVISVWGSDVFRFPTYSFIHRRTLIYSFTKADKILATSNVLKEESKKYTLKEIAVIPFGIDTEKFSPKEVNSIFKYEDVVIGTIKALEYVYGVEYLIRAFKIVKTKLFNQTIKLLVVGSGTLKESLEKIVKELELENDTVFTGYIGQDNISDYHNMLDIYVAVSLEESFGVSVIEASACSKPVIVSNVGGLLEVVEKGKTGFIVEPKNPEALAEALIKLINNPGLRVEMGRNGRNKVLQHYQWDDSVKKMIGVYNSLLN